MKTRLLALEALKLPKGGSIPIAKSEKNKFWTYMTNNKLSAYLMVRDNRIVKKTDEVPDFHPKRRSWLYELRALNLKIGETTTIEATSEERQRYQTSTYHTGEFIISKDEGVTKVMRLL